MRSDNSKYINEALSGDYNLDEIAELLDDTNLSEWAGELLDEKRAQSVNNAVADAQAFLRDRTDSLKSLGLPGTISGDIEMLDNLPNTTEYPEAFVSNPGGEGKYGKILYGTQYDTNDVTGTDMPVISADPTDNKKPLSMFLGSREQAAKNKAEAAKEFLKVDNASEYVQRQILRRMGFPAQMNNVDFEQAPDFRIGDKIVDGQIRRGLDNKLQAFTWVDPVDSEFDFNKTMPVRLDESNRVQGAISQFAGENPELNLKEIVDKLSDPDNPNRQLKGPKQGRPIEGKLYVEDPRFKKDAVFYTHLTPEQARANQFSDTVSYAPQDVDLVNINKAKDVAENLIGDELVASLKVNPNNPGPVIDRRTGQTKFPKRTQINIDIPETFDSEYKQTGTKLIKRFPQIGQFLDTAGKLLRNPAVRVGAATLSAVPVLGDTVDASTGTYDAITKKGDERVRGVGNASAGIAGLTALAAPAAAPVLAPISAGLGIGNALADNAQERREADPALTINSDKAENAGAFIHTETAPVTIQAPTARRSSWADRRRNRRSSG